MATGFLEVNFVNLSILSIASMSVGIYGLRGLYFALLEESKIPIHLTGSAVGIISVLGYTPDIFMGPVMGSLLDNNPGAEGHHLLFFLLSGFSVLGMIVSWRFRFSYRVF